MRTTLLGLVEHYRDQTEYSPLLSGMFNTTEQSNMFWVSLDHDIQLISRRSQNLEDHEINLTQKAFKLLHSADKFIPAANLYVELILGVGPVRPISESPIHPTLNLHSYILRRIFHLCIFLRC